MPQAIFTDGIGLAYDEELRQDANDSKLSKTAENCCVKLNCKRY